ncbi:ester cyclase [Dietzia natronolimnaea]|uniref:ester cyclase n=1 Tax=Dietzia natronolimnaea TaxID=161920 RepID=UPI003D133C1B
MSDTRAVIDQHITAFNDRTPDAEPWADTAEMVTPGGTFTGREGVLGFLAVFQQAFSDGTLRIHSAVIDGGDASVEGSFEGTHDGILQSPAGPVEATGRPVTFRWSATYRVEGDRLMSEHLYFDQFDFLGQLGLLPK